MVIVLKYNVLYVENKDMLQEMNVVHYETYTDHQMATENKTEMYVNQLWMEQARSTPDVDLIQEVDQ